MRASMVAQELAIPSEATHKPARPAREAFLFAAIAVLFAAFTIVTTIRIVIVSYTPLPQQDMWDYWRWFPQFQRDWSMLFSQHNEHRLALGRLFFLLDHHLFHGTGVFLLVCTFLIWSAQWLLVSKFFVPAVCRHDPARAFFCAMAAVFLFAAQQSDNFVSGFQIQFPLMYALATMAAIALGKSAGPGPRGSFWLAVAIAAAAGCTLSTGGGLFIWPALAAGAILLRLKPRNLAVIALSGALAWALYFNNYRTPPYHSSFSYSLQHLPQVLRYLLILLGAPVDDLVRLTIGVFGLKDAEAIQQWCDGICGAVIGCAAGWALFRSKATERRALDTRFVVLLLFLLMTFVATALGRSLFPPLNATASRYRTGVLLSWVLLGLFSVRNVRLLHRFSPERLARLQFAACLAGFVLVVIGQPFRLVSAQDVVMLNRDTEAACLNPDLRIPQIWQRLFPEPDRIAEPMAYLKANHLSLFAPAWTHWTHFTAGGECDGRITSVTPVEGNAAVLRITGWVAKGSRVVVIDRERDVVGFGVTGAAADPRVWTAYLAEGVEVAKSEVCGVE